MVMLLIATIDSVASPASDSISSKIVSTKLTQTADSIEIRFRADRSIPAFQRPERNGSTIVFRLTGVVHADTALAATLSPAHITDRKSVV